MAPKSKQPIRATGFDEKGGYDRTFKAISYRDRCGLVGLNCVVAYGGFGKLNVPTFTIDPKTFTVRVQAKNPMQLVNMVSGLFSYEEIPDGKQKLNGNMPRRFVCEVLRKMRIPAHNRILEIPESYVLAHASTLQALFFPNVKHREAVAKTPDASAIKSWVSMGCPDISTLPIAELKAMGSLGFILSYLAGGDSIDSTNLVGLGSINHNNDSPLSSSVDSLFFSLFVSICSYIGYISQINTGNVINMQMFGIPDVVDVNKFTEREFVIYVKSLCDFNDAYEERRLKQSENPDPKKREISRIRYNPVLGIVHFTAITMLCHLTKRNNTIYRQKRDKSAIGGMYVVVYNIAPGAYLPNYIDNRYVVNNSEVEWVIANINEYIASAKNGANVDVNFRISDPWMTGILCERSLYDSFDNCGSFAQNIVNGFSDIKRALREKYDKEKLAAENVSNVTALFVVGSDSDNGRPSIAYALYKNLTVIRSIITTLYETPQGNNMNTMPPVVMNAIDSTNRMLEFSSLVRERVRNYLSDISTRHGKSTPDEQNKSLINIFYALNREHVRNVRNFVLYRFPRIMGQSYVIGFEDYKITELMAKMSDAEIYNAIVMALRFNSKVTSTKSN